MSDELPTYDQVRARAVAILLSPPPTNPSEGLALDLAHIVLALAGEIERIKHAFVRTE